MWVDGLAKAPPSVPKDKHPFLVGMHKSIEFLINRNSMLFFYTFAPEAFEKLRFEQIDTNYQQLYDLRHFQ